VPKAALTITKLLWLAHHEPESFARIRHILLPHDWLVYKLTGRRATERSEASGTGYFSPWLAEWQPDLLDLIDPSIDWMARLPELVPSDEPVGIVLPDAARKIGLPSAIPVSGVHDNAASALGLGIHPGDVVISLGTSGTIFALHPEPVKDETATVDGNADATGHFLPLVCVFNATQATDMVCGLLQVNHLELANLALQVPVRPDRAILLAYLNGERNPDRPYSRGVLAGIRSDLTRGELARAAFEGVLCGLYRGYKALQRVGVRTVGGSLHPLWIHPRRDWPILEIGERDGGDLLIVVEQVAFREPRLRPIAFLQMRDLDGLAPHFPPFRGSAHLDGVLLCVL
jgi:xylulokinase